jgi:hypothetical protein
MHACTVHHAVAICNYAMDGVHFIVHTAPSCGFNASCGYSAYFAAFDLSAHIFAHVMAGKRRRQWLPGLMSNSAWTGD